MKRAFFHYKRWAFALLLLVVSSQRPWDLLPAHWKPWTPLQLDHPINAVTRMKLSRLQSEPEACLSLLATVPQGSLDYLALEDYTPVESCPLSNVVRVRSTAIGFNAPFTLSCPLLVRWVMFEQQALQPLALKHQGSALTKVEHFGTFACRNVYGRATGRRSQHSTASAFDVAAFTFENGAVANVLKDWDAEEDPQNSAFLHAVHDEACRYFGTVLGPDYNQPHENHFHLDTSNFNLCR
ncbi:MAG: extensin family protein [Pseudomonadota bacterium]